jgi:hypothetical protein
MLKYFRQALRRVTLSTSAVTSNGVVYGANLGSFRHLVAYVLVTKCAKRRDGNSS